jgi:uncharacterized protein YndB with AHSA1/START domain
MVDILHRVAIKAAPERVYDALTTTEGLSGWWARDTTGDGQPGGTLAFRFGPGGIDMAVREAVPGERVLWEVVDGPEEWLGTQVRWELRPEEDSWTGVMFHHEGWREPVDFMHHCSTKWATFLMSLKASVETGTGAPDPDDVKVDTWN